jgi:predicted dehydrogenase
VDISGEINKFMHPKAGIHKVLICGLGSIGRRHLRILHEHWKDVEVGILRSGCGPYYQEIELADQVFTTLSDSLSWKPDAAIICTPASNHLSTALILARQGIPLLIEKPVGDGTESRHDWQELSALSVSVPMEVGYVLRHDPCRVAVKNYIEEKRIGRLVEADFYCGSWLPDWRTGVDYRDCVSANRALGGGALLELSHEIDLAQSLLGNLELRASVLNQSGLLEIDVEDQAHLLAYSDDQCLVSIRINFCTQPPRRHIHIRGSNGEINWNLIAGKVEVTEMGKRKIECFQSPISSDERYRLQMEHFFSCAVGKKEPLCSLSNGLKTLGIVRRALEVNSRKRN